MSEELENLSAEILAERLSKFYQELKQEEGKDYSRSAHVAIRAGINRYLTSETVGKTFSIITDPIFKTGEANCPVQLLKNLIQVLNPGEEALFQRPKRKFCASDEIWFNRAPLGVNTLGNMMKEISIAANL